MHGSIMHQQQQRDQNQNIAQSDENIAEPQRQGGSARPARRNAQGFPQLLVPSQMSEGWHDTVGDVEHHHPASRRKASTRFAPFQG